MSGKGKSLEELIYNQAKKQELAGPELRVVDTYSSGLVNRADKETYRYEPANVNERKEIHEQAKVSTYQEYRDYMKK